jgi:membrane protease YdiL (CAAX protease family)
MAGGGARGGSAAGDGLAGELRGLGPVGVVAAAVILLAGNAAVGAVVVPVGALLVLLWARWSGTPWRAIGYARPGSWVGTVAAGIALGVALKLVMKAVVMPLLGAEPVNQAYQYLAGNRALLPAAAWAMVMAGFGEETVFRGYLFERLGRLLGSGVGAKAATVALTSGLFGAAHYAGQGVAGVEQGVVVGLVLGTVFAATGRIWLPMVAHAAFDLVALGLIYWGLEEAVAGLVFG